MLGPLEAKIRKLREMQGLGGTPSAPPTHQERQKAHAEKQQKAAVVASSSSSSSVGCSTTTAEAPRNDPEPPRPPSASGDPIAAPAQAPQSEAQAPSAGEWRVTLAAPDVSSASEVQSSAYRSAHFQGQHPIVLRQCPTRTTFR